MVANQVREEEASIGSLKIIIGESARSLAHHLIEEQSQTELSPFDDEIIVVQSLGMDRWLRQQMASLRGCAASLDMQFPTAFCRSLASSVQPGREIDARFSGENLTWAIDSLLGDTMLMKEPEYLPLQHYLIDASPTKRFALSRQIAERFVEYGLYRPDMLLEWESGSEIESTVVTRSSASAHYDWQKSLWQRLTGNEEPWHFARWFVKTSSLLENCHEAPEGLPMRVSVFGIPTLPPLFVRLLAALARFRPVSFYILKPDSAVNTESDKHSKKHTSQHSIFAQSLGRESTELVDLLKGDGRLHNTTVQFVYLREDEHTQLSYANGVDAQSALLRFVQRSLRDGGAPASMGRIESTDRSLRVHDCHSLLREVEVLRDQILDAFSSDPTLRPHDILVMVPDVELYGPLVQSVFAAYNNTEQAKIPFQIADRSLTKSSAVAQACMLLLHLVTSRMGATEVLHLLALDPVCKAVGITDYQVEQVRMLVLSASIHWGWNAKERAERWDVPYFNENSWQEGLNRLMAGYAAGPSQEVVNDVLPVAGDLSGDSEVLGAFVTWVNQLYETVSHLRESRTLAEWYIALNEAFTWLIHAEDTREQIELSEILNSLKELEQEPAYSNHNSTESSMVQFEVIREWVTDKLASDRYASSFLTGGMTVCAMKPMRSIPHRFIAMLGMNDASFPRKESRSAFDLIGYAREPGDRDLQADDRQLVLDTLLCAESRLHFSYIGRSLQKNTEVPPSVVLDELFSWISELTEIEASELRAKLITKHFLQPFNVKYFQQSQVPSAEFFSYDRDNERAALASINSINEPPFFAEIAEPIRLEQSSHTVSSTGAGTEVIELQDLIAAWRNPSEFHATRVLRIALPSRYEESLDVEPMEVSGLRSYKVQEQMIKELLYSAEAFDTSLHTNVYTKNRMPQYLPPASLGVAWSKKLSKQVQQLISEVGQRQTIEPQSIEIEGNGWTLTGRLDDISDGELLFIKPGTIRAKDLVSLWIKHLAAARLNAEHITKAVGFRGSAQFAPVLKPLSYLDELIAVYKELLVRPIAYFPNTADACRKYLTGTLAGATASPLDRDEVAKIVEHAEKVFHAPPVGSNSVGMSDADDPYVALLWRGRDPFVTHSDEFIELTRRLWVPLDGALASAIA